MPAFRYVFNMEEHRPALKVSVLERGALVNETQTAVNTVTVHSPHDFAIGDKFLYALTRSNIRTERIFTVTASADTSVTFSGAPFTFPDKSHLINLGADTGGVLQTDGSYSKLNWDGSTVDVSKSPDLEDLYTNSEIAIDPGGEVGFWADATDIWVVARSTGGAPLRIYIFSFVDAAPTDSSSVPTPIATAIDGALAWYRADAIVGLANGANVSSWQDLSGNGNHLTAAGCTGNNLTDSIRPTWNQAGSTKGLVNLPAVAFEGTSSGGAGFGRTGFFTIDTGFLTLAVANGWTIAMILKDYATDIHSSFFIGSNGLVDSANNNIRMAGSGSQAGQMTASVNGTDAHFGNSYAHTDGSASEAHVLRCAATSGTLRQWLNGALLPSTGNGGNPYTRTQTEKFYYLGRNLVDVNNVSFSYNKSFAEFIVWSRALTDTEVGTVNQYLLERMATAQGALSGQGIPRNIGTGPMVFYDYAGAAVLPATNSACTNGTAYTGCVFVPGNIVVTGIQYLVGSVGGTDKVVASIHDSSGALIASSAVAGTTVGTANQLQQVPLTAPAALTGPAWYFLALTFNGTTAKFRTIPIYGNVGNGIVGNGVAQTFGSPAAFTAPTTFTADKVPIMSLY